LHTIRFLLNISPEVATVIRKYESKDVDDVLEAWESASKLAHPFVSAEFLASERHNIPNLYLPNAETWVWETDNRVVGFIALIGNEVGAIFLQPEYRGRGIGRALMDHARDLRGELEVQVFEANTIGRSFYAKYGFEQVEELVNQQSGLPSLRLILKPRPENEQLA
jgi:putative acetyltransferase